MVVILLGPPGVGKGTQGVLLAEAAGWTRISTGDLLRDACREETPLGLKAKAFMDAGELVPDEVILGMVRELLEGLPADRGIIFDGFPRTAAQAEALDRVLPEVDRKVDAVVVLEAPDEILVRRISGRRMSPAGYAYNVYFNPPKQEGICDQTGEPLEHRKDDKEDTVRRRLEVYQQVTQPLIRFYDEGGTRLVRLDGDREMEVVQAEIQAALLEGPPSRG